SFLSVLGFLLGDLLCTAFFFWLSVYIQLPEKTFLEPTNPMFLEYFQLRSNAKILDMTGF
ncbi:hypothetical protein, partial [Bacillus cereus]|uniref:hypothetical protein n=1 Tax=Bacillus cereus TaxID=1396 RepID=UPI001C3F18A8